jgi:hypothetical protein
MRLVPRFGLLLLIASVGVIWFLARDRKTPHDFATSPSHPQESSPGREPSLEQPAVTSDERREVAIESALLRGRVVSVAAGPVRDARVIWLSLTKADAPVAQTWSVPEWEQEDRWAGEARSDINGFFELSADKEHPHGSVLIAFHPQHYPGGIDLTAERGQWPTIPQIELEPATPVQVRVVDPSGKPRSGATVNHASLPRSPRPEQPPIERYERFFAQKGLTGPDGKVVFPPFRGEQVLWAQLGGLISVPWQGPQPSSVVLTLGESFTIGGTVAFPDWSATDAGIDGEPRITVSGLTGNLWRQVAILRDVPHGPWGPMRVSLAGISRYRIRLEGGRIIPVEELFDPPRRDSHQRIDFIATAGAELVLQVADESANPISTARAEAWSGPRQAPSAWVHGTAGPDGAIRLGGLPAGLVRFNVSAPHHAAQELMEIEISDSTTLDVTLQKGGSIGGRCVHENVPVTDFEVIYWKVANIRVLHSETFLGREDGSFQIEGLVPGDWSLHAASPTFPSGRPVTVSVTVEDETQVELELPTAIRGGGRVIDADTGEPVAGARVQPHTSGGLDRGLPWGPGVLTSEDGSFDVDAFTLGLNHLTVDAHGFAVCEVETNATSTDFVDCGDIRLVRPQVLQVSLLGLERSSGLSPEAFLARTEQGYILPEKRFDSAGVVQYANVPPGDLRFIVVHPDGSWARLGLRLDPGKDWTFDLKVAGERKLDVHVAGPRGQPLPYTPSVLVRAQEDNGILVLRFGETDGGRASFEGIRTGKVQISVLDPDLEYVASREIDFATDSSSIEILVGEEPLRVHVVDADRAPVPGASIRVRSNDGAESLGLGQTDADGWAELVGLPSGSLLMDVQHGVLGRSFGVPIDASAKELEFVLDAGGSLELELSDGDMPLPGVLTRIQTKAGLTLGDARQTDDQGRVRYDSLGEGSYHLACHRDDCWPTTVDEDLAPGEQARVRVQMRRLADLEFKLLGLDGLPIADVPVEFESIEFDVPIDAWLAAERIRAPGGLTTDKRGTIRVEGLPRGSYSWSLTAFEQPLSGSIELEPAKENRASAFLQH